MPSFLPVFAVYPLWFYLKASRDVSKVVNGSRGKGVSVDEVGVGLVVERRGGVGGFLDLPHSGWTTEPRFSVSNPPALCPLALSVTICASMKKKSSLLNQRHLLPEAQPVALLSGEDNTADERTHREHIYPGAGPGNCIPMDLLEEKKKTKKPAEHILHVNIQN